MSRTSNNWRDLRWAQSVSVSERAGSFLHAKHLRHRRRHQRGITDRSELDQPHAVAVRIHHFGRRLQREPGLADAARAHERQQAFARQQPLDLHQLALAADERRQRLGQIRALAALRSVPALVRKFGDRSDETITAPGQRLDPALPAGRLREHATERRDLHREIAFLDDDARPRGVQDAGLGDVLVGLLDQSGKDGHRARAQRYGRTRFGEHAGPGIKAKRPNFVNSPHNTCTLAQSWRRCYKRNPIK